MKILKMGGTAPNFDLKDQNGRNVRLSDFSGKKLFLYFYPKANTSG
jgi:peroxiredoxin Q/BCP